MIVTIFVELSVISNQDLAHIPKETIKPWGRELLWARTDTYAAKILEIFAGHRLSLQHHEHKEETIRVQSGTLELVLENDNGELRHQRLSHGACAHILPGRRHRFIAVTDVVLFEVSTTQLDDVVRHCDDYGRAS